MFTGRGKHVRRLPRVGNARKSTNLCRSFVAEVELSRIDQPASESSVKFMVLSRYRGQGRRQVKCFVMRYCTVRHVLNVVDRERVFLLVGDRALLVTLPVSLYSVLDHNTRSITYVDFLVLSNVDLIYIYYTLALSRTCVRTVAGGTQMKIKKVISF